MSDEPEIPRQVSVRFQEQHFADLQYFLRSYGPNVIADVNERAGGLDSPSHVWGGQTFHTALLFTIKQSRRNRPSPAILALGGLAPFCGEDSKGGGIVCAECDAACRSARSAHCALGDVCQANKYFYKFRASHRVFQVFSNANGAAVMKVRKARG